VLGDLRIEKLAAQRIEVFEGAFLVRPIIACCTSAAQRTASATSAPLMMQRGRSRISGDLAL